MQRCSTELFTNLNIFADASANPTPDAGKQYLTGVTDYPNKVEKCYRLALAFARQPTIPFLTINQPTGFWVLEGSSLFRVSGSLGFERALEERSIQSLSFLNTISSVL